MIPIIAAVGTSKSGKTTLIEYLISHLSKEGLRIGTIKHVHHSGFSIDAKGKDSWRHSQAGAQIVVIVAPEETAIIRKVKPPKQEIERIYDLVRDEKLDLLIIEGFHSLIARRRDIFKIITVKEEKDLKRALEGTVDPILAVTGIFAKKRTIPQGITIPIIDIEREGKKLLNLVKNVIQSK
jgi:molybdopterin-guanine dinucleotide biosynthesis protein MobB